MTDHATASAQQQQLQRKTAQPQKTKAACNDMRLAGDALYMKRDSGEIVKFEPN